MTNNTGREALYAHTQTHSHKASGDKKGGPDNKTQVNLTPTGIKVGKPRTGSKTRNSSREDENI